MCYSFFPLLNFCYRAYWSVNPWGTCFTWSHPRRVAFQFNLELSWLLRYRHLAILDSFHFAKSRTNPFLYSINLELQSENAGHHKPSTNPWDGEFLYRITSCRMPKTICNTTWMNLCPNLESVHDSLKNRNLIKVFSYSTKTQYSKFF